MPSEVNARIGAAGPQLTTAERPVAQVILERTQLSAFGTVAALASALTVSKAGADLPDRAALQMG